ncbi:MAG: class I SAM-dependent methyltransferase [Nitrospirae bacterium]|nr:class I SAM-dependent methyltransferase [Nitrospirota bacterium]
MATDCIACGSKGEALYTALPDRMYGTSVRADYHACPRCGLIWQHPQLDPEQLANAYTAAFYTHSASAGPPPPSYSLRGLRDRVRSWILHSRFGYPADSSWAGSRAMGRLLSLVPSFRSRATHRLGVLFPPFAPGGRLLDVGCGNGRYLEVMRGLGWAVTGVEPDAEAAGIARARGLSVLANLQELDAGPAAYHVITSNHAVEHMTDPLEFFRRAEVLLVPGGTIRIAVPNGGGLGHRWFGPFWPGLDPPRHLWTFTPRALAALVEKARLSVETLATSSRLASGFSAVSARAWFRDRFGIEGGAVWMASLVVGRLVQGAEGLARPLFPGAGEEICLVARKSFAPPASSG